MQIKSRSSYKITAILLALLLFVFSGIMLLIKQQSMNGDRPEQPAQLVTPPRPKIRSISSKMLFMGTTFWGRYINDWSMKSELKYAYPFSRLHEFGRDKYDAWIAGLECPTSPRVHMTSAQQEANLQFNCRPEYLPEAAKFFTIFGLANNHTDNQGELGFSETKAELDKYGIQYFGHYDPEKHSDVCEIVAMPAKLAMSDGRIIQGQIPVALCGYHGFIKNPSKASRAVLKTYAERFVTIATPHSGVEYRAAPDAIKTDLYRELIDNGADVVLADHPHWIQNSESYKGRLIVYSMGNFMFDQQLKPETTRSAAIGVELVADANSAQDFQAWTDLAKTCKTFQDDCLKQAVQRNLPKLKYRLKFKVVGSENSNRIVRPANQAEIAAILRRLRWSETAARLEFPYSAE